MDPVEAADLVAGSGIAGNANQGGRRQVTILEREAWDGLMNRFESSLSPSRRRANLLVTGISLVETHGRTLQIGSCRILINGETKPCEMIEELLPGLKDAMYPEWRGGAFGEVLNDGTISVGDEVEWVG
jgi:MOSC domain-containing protein YiiM